MKHFLACFMAGGDVLMHGDFDAQCLSNSAFVTKNSVLLPDSIAS